MLVYSKVTSNVTIHWYYTCVDVPGDFQEMCGILHIICIMCGLWVEEVVNKSCDFFSDTMGLSDGGLVPLWILGRKYIFGVLHFLSCRNLHMESFISTFMYRFVMKY